LARPTKTEQKGRKLRDILSKVTAWLVGDYKASAPTSKRRYGARGTASKNRIRCETPTRDFAEFEKIYDILSNLPEVEGALAEQAQDAAVDENGDDRGFSVNVLVDPEVSDEEYEWIDPDDEGARERRKAVERAKHERRVKALRLQRLLQSKVDAMIERTGIGRKAESYIRKYLETGDCFVELAIEIGADGIGKVLGCREIPTWQTRPLTDDAGRLIGYAQHPRFEKEPVVWDMVGQVIHFKANPSDYHDFGASELEPLYNHWETFKLLDMDLAVACHTRALDVEVHTLGKEGFGEVTDAEIQRYEERQLLHPADIRRMYVVRAGQEKIDKLKGDSQAIAHLSDQHARQIARMVRNLGKPLSIAGTQADTENRHQASVQQNDYARRINSVRRPFTAGFGQMVDLEILLSGVDVEPEALKSEYGVEKVHWEIRWPDLSETRGQREKRISESYTVGLISHETALYERGHQDPRGEMAKIEAERARGLLPLGKGTPSTPNGDEGPGVPNPPGEDPSRPDKVEKKPEEKP
jgi:hypothetical protein